MDMNVKACGRLARDYVCIFHQNHRPILPNCCRAVKEWVETFVEWPNIHLSLAVRSCIVLVICLRSIYILSSTSDGNTLVLHRIGEAFLNCLKLKCLLLKVHLKVPIVRLILPLHQISNHSSIVIEKRCSPVRL